MANRKLVQNLKVIVKDEFFLIIILFLLLGFVRAHSGIFAKKHASKILNHKIITLKTKQ